MENDMNQRRLSGLWVVPCLMALGCASAVDRATLANESEQELSAAPARLNTSAAQLAAAGSGAVGARAAAAASRLPEPGLTRELSLQLIEKDRARLGIAFGQRERDLVRKLLGGDELKLQLDPKDEAVSFNDVGKGVDVKAGDGVFSGLIPINLDALAKLNAEAAQLKERTIVRVAPGMRELVARETLSDRPIDLEALLAGREIRLPPLGEFGPIKTLGGVSTSAINPQKSLLIRSLPVVEDPSRTMNPCNPASQNDPLKPWTFGHLMEQMAQGSGLTASAFVERWLNAWMTPQTVVGSGGAVLDSTSDAAASSMANLVIDPWRARSGGGDLDLRIAPFRLLAILYRPDLGQPSSYAGKGGNAGELRFVFGLMNARDLNHDGDATDPNECNSSEMSVIFEYGVPLTDCNAIKAFANQWVTLSSLLPGDPMFNGLLESLTESVVVHGAAPSKPNQNALNQLRANEIDLTGIWQMREFGITPGNGPLFQTTTKNNPREHQAPFTATPLTPAPINLNGSALFLNELLANIPALLSGAYSVPELSGGQPFLGGSTSYNFGTFWDHPALSTPDQLEARFQFSKNTCSGCHTGETATTFYHIRPTGPGSPAAISNFLAMSPFTVMDTRGINHTFVEMDNRKQALANFANATCSFKFGLPPFQVMRAPTLGTE
jgi:hypothetical protein